MANTVIQLKFSDVTSAPPSLNVGEAAYSNTSQKLFIGDSSSNVLTIGGKFYVDQQGLIFTKTNVAFDTANSAASYANAAFATANSGGSGASYANSAFASANSAGVYANSAFLAANTPSHVANSAASYANSGFSAANTADAKATSAGSYANSAFLVANTPTHVANSAASYANSAFVTANSSGVYANSAFAAANTKLSSSGGTITGNLDITGNLTVSGNTTFVDTEILSVQDSLIKLANNNTAGDTLDIGFYGLYDSSGQKYAGLARNAGTDNFFLFKGLTSDPAGNTLASGSVTAANAATLIANVSAYSVTINNVNVETYIGNAFSAANTADAKAVSAGSYANSAFLVANTPSHVANSAASYANSGFAAANTADAKATSAGSYANSAFLTANTPSHVANSAASYANSGFASANTADAKATSAGVYANSAFATANTDVTGITITAADHGSASAVAAFRVEANGRISSANSTAIAIAASAITSGILGVARGGSGAGTFTTNAVLLGNGTSAFNTASSSTEGHVLTINASGVPTFSHLQGGTF